jgi:hypothetical protein
LGVQIKNRKKDGKNSAQTARNVKRTSHCEWQAMVNEMRSKINNRGKRKA